jgi:hypothetical protein
MATHDWVMARLESTVNTDSSLRLARQDKGGLSLASAACGGSISGKMRDMNSLWRSEMSGTQLLTNISDPLADAVADTEAQKVVANFFVKNASRDSQNLEDETEITKLLQLQSALQTSARVLSRIAAVSSRF